MNTWYYLIAGGGLFVLALLLLWISGNKPKFIPDFPINIMQAAKPRSLDSFLKPKIRKPKPRKREIKKQQEKIPTRFSKGMDLHDWQIVRNNNIREIAEIKDPLERIKKLDALEKRSKKYMEKSWVAQGLSRHGYQLKVEAKHEIKEKSYNQLIKDVYNVSDGTMAGLIKSNQLKDIEQVQHRFVTFVKDSKDITNNPEYFSWQDAWDMFERQDPELQAKKETRIKELNRRSARQAAEALTKEKIPIKIRGITRKQVEKYDPEKAVEDFGRGKNQYWVDSIGGEGFPIPFDTKREAIQQAKSHKAAWERYFEDPEAYGITKNEIVFEKER